MRPGTISERDASTGGAPHSVTSRVARARADRQALRARPGSARGVRIDPRPPDALDDVRLGVWLRGAHLALHLQGRHLHLSLDGMAPQALALRHRGEHLRLAPGGSLALACR